MAYSALNVVNKKIRTNPRHRWRGSKRGEEPKNKSFKWHHNLSTATEWDTNTLLRSQFLSVSLCRFPHFAISFSGPCSRFKTMMHINQQERLKSFSRKSVKIHLQRWWQLNNTLTKILFSNLGRTFQEKLCIMHLETISTTNYVHRIEKNIAWLIRLLRVESVLLSTKFDTEVKK